MMSQHRILSMQSVSCT